MDTPSTDGIKLEFPQGVGEGEGIFKAKNLKQRVRGGFWRKSLLWERYEYFLQLHINKTV